MDAWLLPSLRFGYYLLLLGLFGLMAYATIWQRLLAERHEPDGSRSAFAVGILAAFLLSVALMLAQIAEMMGQPALSLDLATVTALVTTTPMGRSFLVREALLPAAAVFLLAGGDRRLVTALLGLTVASLSWTGHAAAGEGMAGAVHRANNIVHLLAVGLWIGAVAGFLMHALAARSADAGVTRKLLLAMRRFAPWGAALVALVFVTGVVNIGLIIGRVDPASALRTAYGQLMVAKLAVVGLILACAVWNAAASRRRSALAGPDGGGSGIRAPVNSLAAEMLLMIAVLLLVAVLGMTSPDA